MASFPLRPRNVWTGVDFNGLNIEEIKAFVGDQLIQLVANPPVTGHSRVSLEIRYLTVSSDRQSLALPWQYGEARVLLGFDEVLVRNPNGFFSNWPQDVFNREFEVL